MSLEALITVFVLYLRAVKWRILPSWIRFWKKDM